MERKELEERICSAVNEYINNEEGYDDNAQLCINPKTLEVSVEDSRNVDEDSPEIDCYDVMDFVEMNAGGEWAVDNEAVESVLSEYL
ncbi:MAG: hypothetical protein K2H18_07865 [Muribaculaceae bacterium]|nr:hypothetical protein [Muribaculaceae bacterium]